MATSERKVVELPEGMQPDDVLEYPGGAVGWLQINRPEVLAFLQEQGQAGDEVQLLFVPAGYVRIDDGEADLTGEATSDG